MKKTLIENLVPGKRYYVESGIWKCYAVYVGCFLEGKRFKYHFTFGPFDNWENQFGIRVSKSNLNVYEMEAI